MKGEARMLGLAAIGQLAHAAEDLLKARARGQDATRAWPPICCCGRATRSQDLLEDLARRADRHRRRRGDVSARWPRPRAHRVPAAQAGRARARATSRPAPKPAPARAGAVQPAPAGSGRGCADRHLSRCPCCTGARRLRAGAGDVDGPRVAKPASATAASGSTSRCSTRWALLAGDLLVESARAHACAPTS